MNLASCLFGSAFAFREIDWSINFYAKKKKKVDLLLFWSRVMGSKHEVDHHGRQAPVESPEVHFYL